MSNIFPKWTNRLPLLVLAGGLLLGGGVVTGVTYYFTPKYTNVGYQPLQPVSFSHKIHAGELGMDCRYCHNGVEKSWFSNIPAASTCMNCHSVVLKDDLRLAPIRESHEKQTPVPWVQIHKTPDYVYFNHSVHVNRGISCVHCHGKINEMDEVRHEKTLSMAFCLDCHRTAHEKIRPLEQVYNLNWKSDGFTPEREGRALAGKLGVEGSTSCSVCHR
ncbi:MAG: cytochrome C [Pedosphaera sp.]|nr:cytochrome C [Pedosphaera sp.]MSU42913.1 cytochrome C [Pedosphaera sp.]